jgi:type I restriction enzyme R subunit
VKKCFRATSGLFPIPKMTGDQYEKKVKEYLKNHLEDEVIRRLRWNQPLAPADLERLEGILVEIGEGDGKQLLTGLLERSEAPTLAYFVRTLVGLDRAAAQSAFSDYLADRSLTPQQMRFVELVIDQLTARGVTEAADLYEPPFSNLHAGGPDELLAGHEAVIEGIFEKLRRVREGVLAIAW